MVTALVCGIISLVFSLISYFVLWWLSIPGIILGIIAISSSAKHKKENGSFNGMTIAGLVTGIIGLVLGAIALIIYIISLIIIMMAA